jgi:outer membrane protein assembly factor BamD
MSFRNSAPVLLLALASVWPVAAQNPSQQGRERPGAARANSSVSSDEAEAFATANDYYEAGQNSTALAAYRAFLKAYPASSLASKAQYRVAELLDAGGNSNKAFDAYQTLVSRYPDTPEFEQAVAQQVIIANQYLQGKRMDFLGIPVLPGIERAQQMYEAILKNAPYSKHAPIAQFNLGLSLERQKSIPAARAAYQTVLDKYPNSDVADDALYQIAYIYMRTGLSGQSQDLSSLVLAKETFEDFLLQYPNSEKAPQARDNLKEIGAKESGDLMAIAKYYDWSKNYKAALIYYNDIIRKQPKSADAEIAKSRIEELRATVGDDALRVGSERAESGEQLALRRRLQAQVETSSLADYSGPPKRDIVPDELPIVKQPRLRTNVRGDVRPLPAPVEPILPTE